MKLFSIGLPLLLINVVLFAQPDTIPAGVYAFNRAAEAGKKFQERLLVAGSSSHLAALEVTTFTMAPGDKQPFSTSKDFEELIIVKEGSLSLTINDSTKTLSPFGIALVIAGARFGFGNTSAQPVTFYKLKFKSKSPADMQRGAKGGGSFMKNWSELIKVNTEKGESRAIFDQPSSMFSKFDAHATALNPGITSHDPHTHAAEEIILVIKGSVSEQIRQSLYPAVAGDVIYLASNVLHNVKNNGSEQCGYFAIQWRE